MRAWVAQADEAAMVRVIHHVQRSAPVAPDTDSLILGFDPGVIPALRITWHAGHKRHPDVVDVASTQGPPRNDHSLPSPTPSSKVCSPPRAGTPNQLATRTIAKPQRCIEMTHS